MENISSALLDWFYKNHRILPFRTDPSPYHVWLSEIMLQQTRVSAALPYYERFLAALPDIPALAACEEEKLHKLWEGLGYYSRVRNLQKAARIVCEQYGGQLPADYDALRALPGIGDYTAGAVAGKDLSGCKGFPLPQYRLRGRQCAAGVLPFVQRPRCRHGTGSEKSVHRPRDGAPAAGCARRLQSGPYGAGSAGLRAERCAPVRKMPARPPVRRPCCGHCIGAAPQSSAQAPQTAACDAGPAGKPGRLHSL